MSPRGRKAGETPATLAAPTKKRIIVDLTPSPYYSPWKQKIEWQVDIHNFCAKWKKVFLCMAFSFFVQSFCYPRKCRRLDGNKTCYI